MGKSHHTQNPLEIQGTPTPCFEPADRLAAIAEKNGIAVTSDQPIFSGRLLLTIEEGKITSVELVKPDQHLLTSRCFAEILKIGGYKITHPDDIGEVTEADSDIKPNIKGLKAFDILEVSA